MRQYSAYVSTMSISFAECG